MKKTLQETVSKLKEDGQDLKENMAVFKWTYPEDPFIEYNEEHSPSNTSRLL